MKVLFTPCWIGEEAYKMTLERNPFPNIKVSTIVFDKRRLYKVTLYDGVISIRRCDENEWGCNEVEVVEYGVVAKDDVLEATLVLQEFVKKFYEYIKSEQLKKEYTRGKDIWLNTKTYEVEIKGW